VDTEIDIHSSQVCALMSAVFRSLASSPAPPARSACNPPISLPNHPTCHEGALASASAPAHPNQGHFMSEGAGTKDLAADERNVEWETQNVSCRRPTTKDQRPTTASEVW
jgi:hypothetical protein